VGSGLTFRHFFPREVTTLREEMSECKT
jgi:hypothetical protein